MVVINRHVTPRKEKKNVYENAQYLFSILIGVRGIRCDLSRDVWPEGNRLEYRVPSAVKWLCPFTDLPSGKTQCKCRNTLLPRTERNSEYFLTLSLWCGRANTNSVGERCVSLDFSGSVGISPVMSPLTALCAIPCVDPPSACWLLFPPSMCICGFLYGCVCVCEDTCMCVHKCANSLLNFSIVLLSQFRIYRSLSPPLVFAPTPPPPHQVCVFAHP